MIFYDFIVPSLIVVPHFVCSARTMSHWSDWQHLIVFLVRPRLVTLSSLLLSLSLSPCRSHPVFIFFCLAILLAFCLLFSAMRQLLSDIEKLGCGCHTRAPKPLRLSHQGTQAKSLCSVCVGVQRRDLRLCCCTFRTNRRNIVFDVRRRLPVTLLHSDFCSLN